MNHAELGSSALWLMLLLGAYHGINPGMGWLFAVALGMQEQKGATVAKSLLPIAIGHAFAVGAAVTVATLLGRSLPQIYLRCVVAAILVGLGVYFLARHRHPRWVRMQVGFRDLVSWSFLMATAHGAGLMVIPVLFKGTAAEASGPMAGHSHFAAIASPAAGLLATGAHTAGYLAVTGLVAAIIYRKVGLAILRKAWFNMDLIWAVALVTTGLITFLM